MRLLTLILNASLILVFCKCGNSSHKTNDDKSEKINIVGNDADEHGCRASAGYVWSNLRQECIRTFEVGCCFLASNTNVDSTNAAYIVLNDNKSKAELYLPNFKIAYELNKIDTKKSDGRIVIFENDSVDIEVVISKQNCFILVSKNPLYVQKIDDENSLYHKLNGIE